jgi:hypothetical protein
VQAHHEDAGRLPAQIERRVGRAEQFDQFIADDLDDLLAGLDAAHDLLADGLLFHRLDEIPGHLEIDIGFEQGHAHLAEGVRDVVLGDFAETAQVFERLLKFAAERVEHGRGG